jgi:hypothetical protein
MVKIQPRKIRIQRIRCTEELTSQDFQISSHEAQCSITQDSFRNLLIKQNLQCSNYASYTLPSSGLPIEAKSLTKSAAGLYRTTVLGNFAHHALTRPTIAQQTRYSTQDNFKKQQSSVRALYVTCSLQFISLVLRSGEVAEATRINNQYQHILRPCLRYCR